MSNSAQSCKTCRFLNIALTETGRRVVRSDRRYCCLVEVPDAALPDCITGCRDFSRDQTRKWMQGRDGATCPFWAKFEKAKGE